MPHRIIRSTRSRLTRLLLDSESRLRAFAALAGSGGGGGAMPGGGGGMPAGASRAPPMAAFVPLGQLARIEPVMGPPMIESEMGQLTGWIYVDIVTSDVGGYVTVAKQHVAREVNLPPGYLISGRDITSSSSACRPGWRGSFRSRSASCS